MFWTEHSLLPARQPAARPGAAVKTKFSIRFRKPKAYVTAGCGDSTATNILRTAQHSLPCICRTHMSFRPGINSLYPRRLPTHCHLLCFDHCSKQMGWLQPPKSHFCLFCKIYLFLSFSIVTALCPNYSAYTAIHRLHGFIFFTRLHFIPFLWKKYQRFARKFSIFLFPFSRIWCYNVYGENFTAPLVRQSFPHCSIT